MDVRTNCQLGDLAIVVSAAWHQNLGQIVEVIAYDEGRPFRLNCLGLIWQVRTVSGRHTLHYRFKTTGTIVQIARGPVPDCRLKPISGLAEPQQASSVLSVDGASAAGVPRPLLTVSL